MSVLVEPALKTVANETFLLALCMLMYHHFHMFSVWLLVSLCAGFPVSALKHNLFLLNQNGNVYDDYIFDDFQKEKNKSKQ